MPQLLLAVERRPPAPPPTARTPLRFRRGNAAPRRARSAAAAALAPRARSSARCWTRCASAGEPRRGEGVDDGQQEDDRGDQVERVGGNPVRKRGEQAVRRGRRIGREGRRERGNRVGRAIDRHSAHEQYLNRGVAAHPERPLAASQRIGTDLAYMSGTGPRRGGGYRAGDHGQTSPTEKRRKRRTGQKAARKRRKCPGRRGAPRR